MLEDEAGGENETTGRSGLPAVVELSDADRAALGEAAARLEHPGITARLTSMLGVPLERALELLPEEWSRRVQAGAHEAIHRALATAVRSLPTAAPGRRASPEFHRLAGMGSGAVGGFFGLPGTLLELPLTTTIMLRAIADIAAGEGEDLGDAEARLACVQVFALGGRVHDDDAAETGYFGLRLALSYHLSTVAARVAERGFVERSLPAAVGLVRGVAARFGVAVSEKLAFQIVPVAGAASGALINAIFIRHFEEMAQGHFTVRRLERRYGSEAVRRAYAEEVRRALAP